MASAIDRADDYWAAVFKVDESYLRREGVHITRRRTERLDPHAGPSRASQPLRSEAHRSGSANTSSDGPAK